MPDFLLELRSEEIPARMQAKAREDLARLFAEQLTAAGLTAALETFVTPRRLALIARGLPDTTDNRSEERRGPRADAPAQALEGFLKSTGLTRDQLEERTDKKGTFLYAIIDKPGRATIDVLADAIPALVRAFPWPKSMRWGAASASTESPRWVRPLTGIVALLGERIVRCEVADIVSGAATLGHRFHHPGIITIGSADDYEAKLRACHVVLRVKDRAEIIRQGAKAAAAAAGLTLFEDEALIVENAGLTEWPVPLLGRFDPAFLDLPREVIVLTMRTNQKYFSCAHPDGTLAPAFVCTANIEATDGGAAIVAGNERVLSARLADAKFFWEADLRVPLEEQAKKLGDIVFHEKLGTVADKVERVAKLARWLVEEGIVKPPVAPAKAGASAETSTDERAAAHLPEMPASAGMTTEHLATLTERAAMLCKADLVTQMVGEFPELQGTIGAHLARAQGEDELVANAIRDHYKPVGQGDEVPTAPVTVAVSLADKLDSLLQFFSIDTAPTGSKDPFALRRAALGVIATVKNNHLRLSVFFVALQGLVQNQPVDFVRANQARRSATLMAVLDELGPEAAIGTLKGWAPTLKGSSARSEISEAVWKTMLEAMPIAALLRDFLIDRLEIAERETGVSADLIRACRTIDPFGGKEDDLVRLLARVHALQAFVETPEGRDLLAGYKRAANILKKEHPSPLEGRGGSGEAAEGEGVSVPQAATSSAPLPSPLRGSSLSPRGERHLSLSYTPEPVEQSLIDALDSAEPRARAAIEAEDLEAAMAALSGLRGPVDAFFDSVMVNDPDPTKRAARLALLERLRDAVHSVADFSKIEG